MAIGVWSGSARRFGDAVRRRPAVVAAIGFLLGVAAGWFVLGWWIAPVRWTDAAPDDLAPAWQAEHVRLVASDFARTGGRETAAVALAPLPAGRREALLESLALEAEPTLSAAAAELANLGVAAPTDTAPRARLADPGWWLAAPALLVALALVLALTRRTPRGAPPHAPDSKRRAPSPIGVRVALEQSFEARLVPRDGRQPRLTWLIHGRRDRPLGAVELGVEPVGAMPLPVLRLRVSGPELDEPAESSLTFVLPATYADDIARAALGDRHVVVAMTGNRSRLAAGGLRLDVDVASVQTDGEAIGPLPVAMTLRLVVRLPGSDRDAEDDPPLPVSYLEP